MMRPTFGNTLEGEALAKQFEYKFVSVKLSGGRSTGRANPAYREDIVEHAQKGWRFVQAFAPGLADSATRDTLISFSSGSLRSADCRTSSSSRLASLAAQLPDARRSSKWSETQYWR